VADSFTSRSGSREAGTPPRTYTFKLDGEAFTATLRTDADAVLAWSEIAGTAMTAGDDDLSSAAGLAFMAQFFQLMLGPEEYRRFRAHLRKHRTDPDVLNEIMFAVNDHMEAAVEEDTSRPTQRSSSSSAGRALPAGRTARIISLAGGDLQPVTVPNLPPGPPEGWPAEMTPVGEMLGQEPRKTTRQGRRRKTG